MTTAWQACLSRPVTDWQPIPAVTSSCLTPLHSSICHFSSSAQSPLPPTPPLNCSSVRLCPTTKRKQPWAVVSLPGSQLFWHLETKLWAETIILRNVTPGRFANGEASSLNGLLRMKKRQQLNNGHMLIKTKGQLVRKWRHAPWPAYWVGRVTLYLQIICIETKQKLLSKSRK